MRAPSGGVVGAGFLVGPRLVMTCAHVVSAALGRKGEGERPTASVKVDFPEFPDAEPLLAHVLEDAWVPVGEAGRGDVAVLELCGAPPAGAAPPPLRRPPSLMDHPFRVEGFPAGIKDGVWATGVIRGSTGPGRQWTQLEDVKVAGRPVERGFSGAPVWDDEANAVVGMVVAADRMREAKVATMIPNAELAKLWPALESALGWRLRFDRQLRGHWSPRARGLQRASGRERRWLFTGRETALRELVSWLEAPPGDDPKGRAVTGGPGSGKSAVIARLVTLADPDERAQTPLEDAPEGTVPPEGIVDVAVHAKGKTLEAVVGEIAAATDVSARSADELVDALIEAELPRVIVLDALDEAAGADAAAIAGRLLKPLASDGGEFGIRVLVGTRRGPDGALLRKLGSYMRELDLDGPDYLEHADLVTYVERTLLGGAESPYGEELAAEVAEGVAERARPSFLVAQLVSRSLLEADEVVDVGQKGWQERFPDNVGDAMEDYLQRFGEQEGRVRDLLVPLAYAEGAGLPETLWPAVASGLARRPLADTDVAWLLRSAAAAYLVEGGEPEGSGSYRLYHEALAEHLRAGRPRQESEGRYARALEEEVPALAGGGGRDWARAHPYVQTHLATHAAAAGCLDHLLEDVDYLVAADPTRLLPALPAAESPTARSAKRVYQQAVDLLRTATPGERPSYLEMAARQTGMTSLADAIADRRPDRPWSVPWARWRPASSHFVLARRHFVRSVAAGEVGGRGVAVAGGEDGTVRVWDLADGRERGGPLTGHDGWVTAVAAGEVGGRAVAVSGGEDGTVRVWDLADGRERGAPLAGHDGLVDAVAAGEVGGRAVAVSGGRDGTVRVWDLADGGRGRGPVLGIGSLIFSLALADGMIVVGTGSGLMAVKPSLAHEEPATS